MRTLLMFLFFVAFVGMLSCEKSTPPPVNGAGVNMIQLKDIPGIDKMIADYFEAKGSTPAYIDFTCLNGDFGCCSMMTGGPYYGSCPNCNGRLWVRIVSNCP